MPDCIFARIAEDFSQTDWFRLPDYNYDLHKVSRGELPSASAPSAVPYAHPAGAWRQE